MQEGTGRHGWRRVRLGPGGAQLWDQHPTWGIHLVLPGVACALVGTAGLVCLSARLEKLSRVDLRLDDYQRRRMPAAIYRDLVGPDGRRARVGGVVTQTKHARFMADAGCGGTTCYVGSPQSERQLRVYDKAAESGGVVQSVRWELQCRGGKAAVVLAQLRALQQVEQLPAVICGILRGFIEFRVRSGVRGQSQRWRLAPWWESLTNGARTIRVSMADKRPLLLVQLARSRWFHQVLPAVSAAGEAQGIELSATEQIIEETEDGVELVLVARDDLVEHARSKRKARHRLIARGVA